MATLTGLRRSRPGHVALEVDGQPWRVVPDAVVVRCGLAAGTRLERPLLRELRRELQHCEALASAGRALARRDLSRQRLRERLLARGVTAGVGEAAVGALEEAGLVDDTRLARTRAAALADRGWGNAVIEARLEREGIAADVALRAIGDLPAEAERARALSAGLAGQRAAWKLLARRGFPAETIEDVVGALDGDA